MLRVAARSVGLGVLLALTALISSAQIPFFTPADSVAKVTMLQGQVSVLKDSYPYILQLGSEVKPQQMIISGPDGYAVFQVSDGSTFEVFANSKVIFRNNPGNLKDLVDMILGRIRVHIEKFGGLPNPNTVRTPTAVISVRGTIFDVVVDDADDSTLIAVTEGQVEVQHLLLPRGRGKLVNQGEVLRVYKDQPLAQNAVDRGALFERVLHALADAAITVARNPGSSGGAAGPGTPAPGSGGPTLPGDTEDKPPPPPPPPAAPPPPPPGN